MQPLPEPKASVDTKGYVALEVTRDLREAIKAAGISPRYPRALGEHITLRYGVSADDARTFLEGYNAADVEIYGMADDGKAVQCLLVRVKGQTHKPDGNPYHITWSIDPRADVPGEYNPDGQPGKAEPRHANIVGRLPQFITIWPEARIIRGVLQARFYQRAARTKASQTPHSASPASRLRSGP